MYLPPILTTLRRAHSDLTIELALSDEVDDLLQRRADIAVRMVAPVQQALVAQRVGDVRLGFHAHRDYLSRRGAPTDLNDLQRHDLIGFDVETAFIRSAMRHLPGIDRSMFALRVDSDAAQFAAIQARFGIGICQTAVAARDEALVRVLSDALDMPLPVWIVMHEDLRRETRYRVVFDALVDALTCVTRETKSD